MLVSSVIRRIIAEYGNASLVLVLPYMRADYRDNMKEYHEYYSEIEICEKSSTAYFKLAIQIRNRNMADRSDLIICYIQRENGGAYQTVQYAKKQHRKIINLSENFNKSYKK